MKTLIIVAHPEIESSTTQKFFQSAIKNFSEVTYHPISFNIDINQEQNLLRTHDRIIFQFPFYWYSAPASLKNWIDNVLTTSFATGSSFALRNKELGLVVTLGNSSKEFGSGRLENFTVDELLRPFEALANKTKMVYLPPLNVHQFLHKTTMDQKKLLVEYQQYITSPNFKHFSDRVTWFEQQIQKRIKDDPANAAVLETILVTIQQNQDELDDLRWNLDQVKKDDDN